MVKAYVLSEQDVAILRDLIARERSRYFNQSPQIPTELLSPSGISPDVYIVKSASGDIPALSGTTPGGGECDVYGMIDGDLVNFGFSIWVHNLSTSVISASDYFTAMRTKFGDWVPMVGGGGGGSTITLVGGCLAENHPGRGIQFGIYPGTWAGGQWAYTGALAMAVDYRYGVPYPNAGATGLFIPREGVGTGTGSGTLYECVALDCTSPGACSTGT